MKNLLIMRHAKSDWENSSISDFDRPLNSRGLKSAPIMGEELLKRTKIPDLIISSPAKRAQSTAELTAKSCNYHSKIIFEKEFYFGSMDSILTIIRNTDDSIQTLMLVGHNPTSEYLIAKLLKGQQHIQMPTAAIASLIFEMESWDELKPQSAVLEWIVIPRDLMQ